MKTGAELITEERQRQIKKEGWTSDHDDEHTESELARVGAIYALPAKFRFYAQAWPKTWDLKWYKPTPQNRILELTKAGALIAAEIDRLQRAKIKNCEHDYQYEKSSSGESELMKFVCSKCGDKQNRPFTIKLS